MSRLGNKFWCGSDAFSDHTLLQVGFDVVRPTPGSCTGQSAGSATVIQGGTCQPNSRHWRTALHSCDNAPPQSSAKHVTTRLATVCNQPDNTLSDRKGARSKHARCCYSTSPVYVVCRCRVLVDFSAFSRVYRHRLPKNIGICLPMALATFAPTGAPPRIPAIMHHRNQLLNT